jgi:hypothetical protein
MIPKTFLLAPVPLVALASVAAALSMASCESLAQVHPPASATPSPPQGAFVGFITVKSLPVKVKLEMKGKADAVLEYGPTLSCALALEFITQTTDGFAYAFKPRAGGSAGMAPYCNRLLGGRAWLKPSGSGFTYLPLDDRGTPLEHASVDPVPASH